MIRKLMIVPWFGPLPDWMPLFEKNFDRLRPLGYDILIPREEKMFRDRARCYLDVECPRMEGNGNAWDFRPALAALYPDLVRGYDFWGHLDFDVVLGRVENWVTDEFLGGIDIHSNHWDYICGCWTLYRNTPTVNDLFRRSSEWKDRMEAPEPSGWAEKGFTAVVDAAHEAGEIRRSYTFWQTRNLDGFDGLELDRHGALFERGNEVMMAHFRRVKVYPPGCIL